MASPTEEERRNWLELPKEVTASILSRLTAEEILTKAQYVCKPWLEVSKDPLVWIRIDMSNPRIKTDLELDNMCRHAVHRSCGQAVDVSLDYHANGDLLHYIAERSSRIKRLKLNNCFRVSSKRLVESVVKLPALEDLELTLCYFKAETIKAVGQECPRLREFKLNSVVPEHEEVLLDEEAVAIGMTMPGLKSLQLIDNSLTNKGLGAILDGCPELESLDLRDCTNICLEGKVWERCVERVKHLRLPLDGKDRNWLELPREVTASILSRLPADDTLRSAQFVCKLWLEISTDPLFWRGIDMANVSEKRSYEANKFIRHAVDRSCGQAVDVILNGGCTNDNLLQYVADRSSRIKRLTLTFCPFVTADGLIKAIEKLPALEDLDLTRCDFGRAIEAVGHKCPLLRAFKLNYIVHWDSDEEDYCSEEEFLNKEAVAIGKSMPGLKSLELIRNSLNNKGLGAILDGCPELESLDLRECDNIHLEGQVWERCVARVKQLRLPQDLIKDDPFPRFEIRNSADYGDEYSYSDHVFNLESSSDGGFSYDSNLQYEYDYDYNDDDL